VLSAYGSAVAEPAVERSRTVMLRSAGPEQLLEAFEALENESLRALAEGAVDGAEPILSRFADLRYQGQSYEVRVRSERDDDAAGLRARFEAEYERLFGHVHADEPIEVVTVRVRTSLPSGLSGLGPAPLSVRGASSACLDERSVIFDEPCEAEIYDRDLLEPGMAFPGPALVVEAHATTLVPDGIWCRLDGFGHLILDLDA
jgi:N-methylhydantoinase A